MMVDFDFNRGTTKLERDQQKRREEARKKRLTEERLKKEKQERDDALVAFKKVEQERQQAALILKELANHQEQILTGGINFQRTFTFGFIYLVENETDDDKIILPEDCLQELSHQEAFSFGPMTFMLTNNNAPDKLTHCGVLQFNAPSGCIGLTRKVLMCLTGSEDPAQLHSLSIKYVRLPKCTYVKLRPKRNVFFEVGPVKSCLEENLRKHSTVSVGDVLTVWFRGKNYELGVTAVRPSPRPEEGELWRGCSLVDADVEVDLDVSEESSAKLLPPPPEGVSKAADVPAPRDAVLDEEVRGELDRELGPEPASGAPGAVLLKLKLPSGASLLRRFPSATSLRLLLLFITHASQLPSGDRDLLLRSPAVQLSIRSSFPPTTIRLLHPSHSADGTAASEDDLSGRTLADVGIKIPQDSIFISVVN